MKNPVQIKVLSIVFMAIYLAGVFRVYTPFLSYNLNYEYISEVLCENRDQPELECYGQCQLQKELKKTAQEESTKDKAASGAFETPEFTSAGNAGFDLSPGFRIQPVVFGEFSENYTSAFQGLNTPPPRS